MTANRNKENTFFPSVEKGKIALYVQEESRNELKN